MELRIVPRTLKLAETFTIAYASSDEERVVGVELHHDGLVGYGEATPVRSLRRDARDGHRLARARGRAARRRPVRVRRDRRAAGGAARPAGRRAPRSTRRCTISSARSADSRPGASSGSRSTRPRPPTRSASTPSTAPPIGRGARIEAGYRRLKIKVGGADDLPRLQAVRAGHRPARPRRRERGLGSRVGPRAAAAAAADGRRARRAAVPRRRPRELPRARALRARRADRDRRGLPHAARHPRDRALRRRRQHQAREERRHPRGRAHDLGRARARHGRDDRLHDRELGRVSRPPRRSRRSATSSTSTATCCSPRIRSRASGSSTARSCCRASRASGCGRVAEPGLAHPSRRARRDLRRRLVRHRQRQGRPRAAALRPAARRGRDRPRARGQDGARGRARTRRATCPIVATVAEAAALGAEVLAIGVAPTGGKLPPEWRQALLEALALGLHVEAGLHDELGADPALREAAARAGRELRDLRVAPGALSTPTGEGAGCPCGSCTPSAATARSAR